MQGTDDDDMEMRKASTMNSMFIGSTISKPNVDSIINAVATILHSQMLEVSSLSAPPLPPGYSSTRNDAVSLWSPWIIIGGRARQRAW